MRALPRPVLAAALAAGVVILAVVGIVLASGEDDGGSTPGERRGAAPGTFFGVNDSLLYASAQLGQDDLSRKHASAMADAGVQWVRFSTAWRGEEPTAAFEGTHHYDFQFLDSVVSVLAESRLPMGMTLYTTPVWAADGSDPEGCTANIRPQTQAFDDFAAYAATVAARYGEGGAYWAENPDAPVVPLRSLEIWNEPNWNAFWCPEPQPEQYAELFVAAAEAIREQDPAIRIVTGGLTSVFEDDLEAVAGGMDANLFIERAMAHRPEIAELADSIGFHPYDADLAGVRQRIARFREGLDANGLGDVPIEINEAGWPTEGPAYPVAEPERAELTAGLADELWGSPCEIDGLAVYAWRTTEETPDASELFYGIADPQTAEPYPTGTAYADAIAELGSGRQPRDGGPCG